METCQAIQGCSRKVIARSLCTMHYQRLKRLGTTELERYDPSCSVDGCDEPHRTNGFCKLHAFRVWSKGDPGAPTSIRRFRPDRTVSPRDGYVRVRRMDHPRADKAGMVLEHLVVMEEMLGRPLHWDATKRTGEQVHHINGVKDDNRPENLELWVTSQPRGQRPDDLVQWALEILARYGGQPDALERTTVSGARL